MVVSFTPGLEGGSVFDDDAGLDSVAYTTGCSGSA